MPVALVSREAERDLDGYADYIARESIEAALRFYAAARSTFRCLAAHPRVGRRRFFANPTLQNIRSRSVDGFPAVLVFYRETEYGVHIIAVVHGARDLEVAMDRE